MEKPWNWKMFQDNPAAAKTLSTPFLKQTINEWRQCRTFGKDKQASQNNKKQHDWRQPPFLPNPKKAPKFL
jgi:hypothetical protein